MLTGCFGFPRIGNNRELKWALEDFWKNKDVNLFFNRLRDLVRWQIREQSALEIICLDFSPYDFVLDTAIDAGFVPLDEGVESYFSFTRGKNAFPMKKWFGNNFHYLSVEVSSLGKVNIEWREWEKKIGNRANITKAVVGPYTMAKLCRWAGIDAIETCKKAFNELVKAYLSFGYEGVLFHEPALAFSPCLDEVGEIYRWFGKKEKQKIRIAIYYNKVDSDVLLTLSNNGFSKIWLDLIDGDDGVISCCDLQEIGLGVVSGRTVEKINLLETARWIKWIVNHTNADHIVIHPSCPLFHLPITTDGEDEQIEKRCSFAKERLKELLHLKVLTSTSQPAKKGRKKASICLNPPSNQSNTHPIPNLSTTVIGSFPQTSELRRIRKLWREGKLSEKDYESFIFDMIKKAIELQEKLGLDVLAHGEFEREDMVEFFANYCDGFYKLKKGWVQSYGNRCVKPPVLLFNPKAMNTTFFKFMLFAKNISNKEVKCILTGPITIVKWSLLLSNGEKYIDLVIAYSQHFAKILKKVIEEATYHFSSIQLDEPALVELVIYGKEYTKLAIPIINTALSTTNTCVKYLHLCYGDVKPLIPIINQLSVDVVLLECYRQGLKPEDLSGLDKIIGVGCFDVHSLSIPSSNQIASFLSKFVKTFDCVVVCPDCGLKTRSWLEVEQALKNMVEGANFLKDRK